MNAIEVKGISKKYKLGATGTGTLRSDLQNMFSKSKENNTSYIDSDKEYWALKNVSFDIKQGEAVGIIGKNGAGKSTMLKILSRITAPTQGKINIKGRIASLLEVGTGFHPELSGRDNIFLNGAILGMSKREIKTKFDEIVEFSGVDKFIDTPVKRYSSGMYVRLAFAVAAYLQSEILIVDEVLAVGDAEFQKKCIGKMNDVTGQGRTVIFVSHAMATIKQLCSRAVYLEKGTVKHIGDINTAINHYLQSSITEDATIVNFKNENLEVNLSKISISNVNGNQTNSFDFQEQIKITIQVIVKEFTPNVEFSLKLKNSNSVSVIFTSLSDNLNGIPISLNPGFYTFETFINSKFLVPDVYYISFYSHLRNIKSIQNFEDVIKFTIIETGSVLAPYGHNATSIACVIGGANWKVKDLITGNE